MNRMRRLLARRLAALATWVCPGRMYLFEDICDPVWEIWDGAGLSATDLRVARLDSEG